MGAGTGQPAPIWWFRATLRAARPWRNRSRRGFTPVLPGGYVLTPGSRQGVRPLRTQRLPPSRLLKNA